ncbi:hypothetical protein [uncultured Campylobacter sp.]|uniref:hypothetical protein n=1 Tax=uncultured Campylobacter sp. TaxID=218934 RepID=UPI0026279CE6|nr:hypothetical protein [uncultured Campylobacter sp.]
MLQIALPTPTHKMPPLHNTGGGSAAGPVIMQIYEKLAQMGYIDANATTNKDSAKKTK